MRWRMALAGCAVCLVTDAGCLGDGKPTSAELLADARAENGCARFPGDRTCVYYDRIERWVEDGSLDAEHTDGAIALVRMGCVLCHTYRNIGASQLGGSNLARGKKRDDAYFARYLANPSAFGNQIMASYAYLGEEELASLASFLAASR